MKPEIIKIRSVETAAHNVLRFILDKPSEIEFNPGQAADISINKDGWKEEIRPFTFTSLPENDYLEFTIKIYPGHKGVTNELLTVNKGDEFILSGIFGAIKYKGEGIFIAGGAGVTPFISILRELRSNNHIGKNKLLFANKTESDIINKEEFSSMLGKNFINILSDEKTRDYLYGYITKEILNQFLPEGSGCYVYICGPPPMMEAVEKQIAEIGIKSEMIVKEEF